MAHFAKINEENIVLTKVVIADSDTVNSDGVEDESVGQQYLETHNNWPAQMWIQTSYNTVGGTHKNGGTPFRGNYAGIGFTYDPDQDVFYPPQPYGSWTLSSNWVWEAPIAYPDDGNMYIWNENAYQGDNTQGWELVNE